MTEQINAAAELARQHDELDRLVCDLAELFVAHADAEERRLYPALRAYLPGGWSVVADQGRRERAIARTIRAIERLPEPEGDAYDVLVGHLIVAIEDHVERQDAVLLPNLVNACPIEEVNRLGQQLGEAVEQALADNQARVEERAAPEPEPRPRGFGAALRRLVGGRSSLRV